MHWPLIPRSGLNFSGAFLRKFDFTRDTLPVVKLEGGLFSLHPELVKLWKIQEDLYVIIGTKFHSLGYARPLTADGFVFPSNHRYDKPHKDEKVVRWRCIRALMRFREHWGLLFYLSLSKISWRDALEKLGTERPELRITPGWLDDLHYSNIFDTPSRTGVFIDTKDLDTVIPFEKYLYGGAPTWVYFADVEIPKTAREKVVIKPPAGYQAAMIHNHPNIEQLVSAIHGMFGDLAAYSCPVSELAGELVFYEQLEIHCEETTPALPFNPSHPSSSDVRAYTLSEPYRPSSPRGPSPPTSPSAYINGDLESPMSPIMKAGSPYESMEPVPPPPYPGSGQAYGHNWFDFFSERVNINAIQELKETIEDRERRIKSNEQGSYAATLPHYPEHMSGAVYFEWVSSDQEGYYLRKQILPDEIQHVWARYHPSQRVYDAHSYQFDLCRPLSSLTVDENCEVLADNDNPAIADAPMPLSMSERAVLDYNPTPSDLQGFTKTIERLLLASDGPLPTLLVGMQWLQWRYGFVLPPALMPQLPSNKWKLWYIHLSAGATALSKQETEYAGHFSRFAMAISSKESDTYAEYLDIFPCNPSYLHPARSSLGVQRVSLWKGSDERVVYRLYPQNSSSEQEHPWIFAVDEATSVVIAIRNNWGTSRDELTMQFMRHGLPFHTFAIRLPTKSTKIDCIPNIQTLPLTPLASFTLEDYAEYETRREQFFSSARGNALCRYGGPIRRLYMADEREQTARLNHVISGPTELASLLGDVYTCTIDGRIEMVYEDVLTDLEKAFLCGSYDSTMGEYRLFIYLIPLSHFYAVNTGSISPEKLSWHMPFDWAAKTRFGINGGIWSNHDEQEYQKRRDNIVNGKATPLNAAAWKKCPKIKSTAAETEYETQCRIYLQDQYIPLRTISVHTQRHSQ